jgi:hypothetical protein
LHAVVWQGSVYVNDGSKTQGGGAAAGIDVLEVLLPGGSGGDTSPPTAPTGLQAVAVSSSRVDLSWTGAADDVGVTEYRIERSMGSGFSGLATVLAPQTSFTDTSVGPSTTYTYRVRACDAAGNCGPFSDQSQVTTPGAGGTLLFSDGFESGFSWDIIKPQIQRQNSEAYAGSWAVRATSTSSDGPAFARIGLPSVSNEVYYQAAFKLISKGANEVILLRVLDSTKNWVMSFGLNSKGKLIHKKHKNGGVTTGSSVVPSQGVWHLLQARVYVNGASGVVEVWLDGAKIDGDSNATRTYDVVFDDVAVDESPIG